MAIIHQATLTPGKLELIESWLDTQIWGGSGEVSALGAYRFDDPDGEVGIEGHLVSRDDVVLHVPLTYRAAALDDPDVVLVGRMQHSVLGERFCYDATTDPVAVGCFVRALRGEQQEAVFELYDGDRVVGRREPTVTLQLVEGSGEESPMGCAVVALDGDELRVARVLDSDTPAGRARLVASWAGVSGTIAGLD